MKYFCFFNRLALLPESRVHEPYASVLLSYQVLHGMIGLWMKNALLYKNVDDRDPLRIVTIRLDEKNWLYQFQTYLVTMQTTYGSKLFVGIKVGDISTQQNVSLRIFDGPILVEASSLDDMDRFSYAGGHIIVCGVDLVNNDGTESGSNFEIIFQVSNLKIIDIILPKLGDKFKTSVSTMQRIGPYYGKYLRVKAPEHFVKLTFAKIHRFEGMSYNCEYGGFLLSDYHKNHFDITGPYCTQHGTEPLVNDVTTFHSMNFYFVFIIYSYTFQFDVDLVFESTQCEGATNICSTFYNRYHLSGLFPVNYIVIFAHKNKNARHIQLIVTKGCVVVQRTHSDNNAVCMIGIYVRLGKMRTVMEMQSNFRQVATDLLLSMKVVITLFSYRTIF